MCFAKPNWVLNNQWPFETKTGNHSNTRSIDNLLFSFSNNSIHYILYTNHSSFIWIQCFLFPDILFVSLTRRQCSTVRPWNLAIFLFKTFTAKTKLRWKQPKIILKTYIAFEFQFVLYLKQDFYNHLSGFILHFIFSKINLSS